MSASHHRNLLNALRQRWSWNPGRPVSSNPMIPPLPSLPHFSLDRFTLAWSYDGRERYFHVLLFLSKPTNASIIVRPSIQSRRSPSSAVHHVTNSRYGQSIRITSHDDDDKRQESHYIKGNKGNNDGPPTTPEARLCWWLVGSSSVISQIPVTIRFCAMDDKQEETRR